MTKKLPRCFHTEEEVKFLREQGKIDGAKDALCDFLKSGFKLLPAHEGSLGDLMEDAYEHGWVIGYQSKMRALGK